MEWRTIPDFPGYRVNDLGQIVNIRFDRIVKPTLTRDGTLKVNLQRDKEVFTRSVKVLVAETFLEPHKNPLFTTPIQYDGDPLNVSVENLTWRSRGYAWKYTKQFRDIKEITCRPMHIMEIRDRIYYESVYDAAVDNGLLFMEVWKSIRITDHWCVPTYQQFYMNQRLPIRRTKGRTIHAHRPK